MDVVDPEQINEQESWVPLDFSADYRQSVHLVDRQLELPPRHDLRQAVDARMSVSPDLVDQVLTAIGVGKHLLFYGPPGTGKTMLAELIAHEFRCEPTQVTASADWTTFETAGGLQLGFEGGKEVLAPRPGIITETVVRCLNHISAHEAGVNDQYQGAWLIIDEMNRANVDSAFGPFFNALDATHPKVTLPFMDPLRRNVYVPSRFRIIGTMNSYDKNFLFRLSYALTRRFALIEVGVPANDNDDGRSRERERLVSSVADRLGWTVTEPHLAHRYSSLLIVLYDRLITKIRATEGNGALGRGIGFAQITETFAQTVLALEKGFVEDGDEHAKRMAALDRAVTASIVPQLEGLPNSKLKEFTSWWAADPELATLQRSLRATRELISGLDLFLTEHE